MTPEETWRWLELWERARDHRLSPQEQALLNDALTHDPEVRLLLARAALQEAELRTGGQAAEAAHREPVAQPPAPQTWQRQKWSAWLAPLAAALVSAGAVWLLVKEPPPVAHLARASACKWGNSELPTLEGSALQPGLLELLDGLATLKFASGAEVSLEAPVTLEILSSMECRIRKGTVVAEVPPQAKGFTIHTPDTKVVDYGTRFGVSAGEDGKCLVHVIEGLVEVQRTGESKIHSLHAGERVDYGGFIRSATFPDADLPPDQQPEPGRWLPGPLNDLGDGWQMVTTAFGRGQDTWIQSDPKFHVSGRESHLRVKHSTHNTNLERKVYLAFDLSEFKGRPIEEAEFTLHVEPSDLGFASLVPDAVFHVYGLTDESRDGWSETALTWENAPAHDQQPQHRNRAVADMSVKLGELHIPQGTTRGAFTIKGDALRDFLNADSNGTATLIITRETNEYARNGLVHAFASKENPRNTPPLLKVRLRALP